MPVVQLDTIEGAAAQHDIIGGWDATRVAIVTGLNADGTLNSLQLFQAAVNAVAQITGDRGTVVWDFADLETGEPVAVYLARFVLEELIGATGARIKIVYRGFPRAVLEFGGSLNQIETNRDVLGNPIVVYYTYPATYTLDLKKRGTRIPQGGLVPRPMPEAIVSVHWIVTANGMMSASNTITWYKALYEGSINALPYAVGYLYGAPHTWLVERIDGVTRNGGQTYEATMVMHYRAITWDPVATFINPDDGKPPPDLQGESQVSAQVCRSVMLPSITFGVN